MKVDAKSSKRGIFLPMVPFNAAVSAISTLVPLSILALGGSVIDVGFALVAYSLALVPAPLSLGLRVRRDGLKEEGDGPRRGLSSSRPR